MNIHELLSKIEWLADEVITQADRVYADKLGLDSRAGQVHVSQDFVAIYSNQRRNFDYYGGGEYVCDSHVVEMGPYTVYLKEADGEIDSRVYQWINYYYNS